MLSEVLVPLMFVIHVQQAGDGHCRRPRRVSPLTRVTQELTSMRNGTGDGYKRRLPVQPLKPADYRSVISLWRGTSSFITLHATR